MFDIDIRILLEAQYDATTLVPTTALLSFFTTHRKWVNVRIKIGDRLGLVTAFIITKCLYTRLAVEAVWLVSWG